MRQPIGRRSEPWQCGARTTISPTTRQRRAEHSPWRAEHSPFQIDGAVVERVKSFKYLGFHIII
jgi:hypothetical protein